MNIAIIPARGGSKRIPQKNIKDFCGKPIIAWSIELAIKSNLFDDIIVSTDDKKIIEIANYYGAKTPFIRPQNISDDLTPTVPVISHALGEMGLIGKYYKFACCIYPCSPFMQIDDLKRAIDILTSKQVDYVYPVTEYQHPIQRCLKFSKSNMKFMFPEHELTRTQDLERMYHDTGQFYWGKSNSWTAGIKMHSNGFGLEIPNWRVVDIDNQDDWTRAEIIFKSFFQK